jgi:hypothetical protein
MAVCATLASSGVALAAAVPGATYNGTASDGATITLKISSNGTRVTAYSAFGIFGKDQNGQTCQDTTSVGPTGWGGAPIAHTSFHDSVGTTFSIDGTFGRAQSASGTFTLSQPAQGGSPGCATGTVSWTATTASKPGNGTGNPGSSGGGRKTFRVRVTFHRLAQRKLLGRLKASAKSCTARRMVYLWSGHRRLGTRRATAKGAFSFSVRQGWHRKRVHASVKRLTTKTSICTAGTSSTVKG